MLKQFLETGEIVTTHGIKGEVKVYPWADSPEVLLEFSEFRIGGVMYEVEKSRVQKNCVLLKLKGVDTVEQAMTLKGKVVEFDRSDIELEDGYFIVDLMGLKVFAGEEEIGKIKDIIQNPGNDVWLVKGEKSYMIPSVPAFIKEVNIEEGYARVELIEGMEI